MKKLKTLKNLKKIVARLKRQGKKVVFTNGCFDILHYGHVRYLAKCRKLGDALVVGLNSDASVRKIKGKGRPVTGQKERAGMLAGLSAVDYVVFFNGATPARLIEAISPGVLAKGGDWKAASVVGARHVKASGGKVAVIPFVKGFSTSGLIKKIRAGR